VISYFLQLLPPRLGDLPILEVRWKRETEGTVNYYKHPHMISMSGSLNQITTISCTVLITCYTIYFIPRIDGVKHYRSLEHESTID